VGQHCRCHPGRRQLTARRSDFTAATQGGHYKFTYLLTAAAAGEYQATTVADGGTIKGNVVYTGSVPVKKIIPKDPEVCGQPRDESQIVVGANKGVEDAIVYLEGVTKGKPMTKPAELPEINNKKCEFVPESQVIAPGPIVIVNSDPVLHNTHGFYGPRTAFNVALPNQGQRVTKELPRPESCGSSATSTATCTRPFTWRTSVRRNRRGRSFTSRTYRRATHTGRLSAATGPVKTQVPSNPRRRRMFNRPEEMRRRKALVLEEEEAMSELKQLRREMDKCAQTGRGSRRTISVSAAFSCTDRCWPVRPWPRVRTVVPLLNTIRSPTRSRSSSCLAFGHASLSARRQRALRREDRPGGQ
jgi:hypothetical protein